MRSRLPPDQETVAALLDKLGGINPRRVRLNPTPGTATEKDLLRLQARNDRLYELVDGTLVEKPMGFMESGLAIELGTFLNQFVRDKNLGLVCGEAGSVRLLSGLVRLPDLAFVSWKQLPERKYPQEPIPGLAPDLVVEVISKGNTRKEMKRKLKEYFLAGVRLVWFVEPSTRTVKVYTSPDQFQTVEESQTLEGGEVLPGFALSLRQLFAHLPDQPTPRRKRRSK